MAGEFREGHYVLGIEGLALLRAGARRDYSNVEARTGEIGSIATRLDEQPLSQPRDLPEARVC